MPGAFASYPGIRDRPANHPTAIPCMSRRFFRLRLAACLLLAALGAPAETPLPAGLEPDELVGPIKLADADIDTVLGALEIYTGRAILRPQALPAATYTLKLNKQVPKSEAVLAIETLLSLNGVGVVPLGEKFLKVVALDKAKTEAPAMIEGSTLGLPPSGKIATKLFQLEFLRASEFVPLITPLMSPGIASGIVSLEKANATLITDTISNLQRVETLLRQLDRPSAVGLTPKFYGPLRNAKASDVVTKLHTLFQGPLQAQLGAATTYNADDRTNQIILLADQRQHALFDDLIAQLDIVAAPNTRNEVIYLKHATAKDVATLLSQLVSGQNAITQKAGSSGTVNPIPGAQPAQPGAAPAPGPTAVPATALAALVEPSSQFSSLITVLSDDRSNAVVVSGTVDDIRLIKDLVDKLDVILAQVRIEVVLAEVTLDDNHTSGISQLGFTVAGDKVTGFSGDESSVGISGGTVTRPGVTGPFDLAATLAIKTTPRKSNTAILSVPSITTTHNKEAKFFFGETRPIVTGTTSTPTAAATTTGFSTNSQVQQQEIGTTITVKPLIGNDGSVQLDIKMDVSDVTGTVQIDNNAQYIIGKRTTNSFITAQTGDILYLSGMQKKKDSRSTSRLGPIPLLGDLLGSRNKDNQRTELIFFFRPTVLTNTAIDNAAALERIKELDQRDAVMKELDPKHQAPPKTLPGKLQ